MAGLAQDHLSRLIIKLKADVDKSFQNLTDGRVTRRKQGLEALNNIISSKEYLSTLDYASLLSPNVAENKGALTWSVLIWKFASIAYDKISQDISEHKVPDKLVSSTLRQLVTLAQASERSGRTALLSPRISLIFRHIIDVLKETGIVSINSQVITDYIAVLKMILEEYAYIVAIDVADWERLIIFHLKAFDSPELSHQDVVHRIMTNLTLFLRRFPGEPSLSTHRELLAFFINLGKDANLQISNVPVRSIDAFDALSVFLLNTGRGITSKCEQLHAGYHVEMMKALHGHDAMGKAKAVIYARIQLQLGGISAASIQDLVLWAEKEIKNAQWKHGFKGSKQTQHELISLLCSIYVRGAGLLGSLLTNNDKDNNNNNGQDNNNNNNNNNTNERPNKRARIASPLPHLSRLGLQAVESPATTAPVAAVLLLQYCRVMPRHIIHQWVLHLAEALPDIVDRGSSLESRHAGIVIWVLYYAHALALTSPLPHMNSDNDDDDNNTNNNTTTTSATTNTDDVDRPHGSGGPKGNSITTKRTSDAWLQIWNILVRYVTVNGEIPLVERESTLWVLARIAERQLCQLPPMPHQIWTVPLLEWSPTPAGIRLGAAALRAGVDFAATAGTWEHSILQWALQAHSAKDPTCDISLVIDAFLRLPEKQSDNENEDIIDFDPALSHTAANILMSPCCDSNHGNTRNTACVGSFGLEFDENEMWVWWISNAVLESQIFSLQPGVEYMHAKTLAIALSNRNTGTAHEERNAHASRTSLLTGQQMHSQAADFLFETFEILLHEQEFTLLSAVPRLESLASICAAALHTYAAVGEACKAARLTAPPCWTSTDTPLFHLITAALKEIAPLLATAASNGTEELSSTTKCAIRMLSHALYQYTNRYPSAAGVTSKCLEDGALDPLKAIFMVDTSPAALPAVTAVLTQGLAGHGTGHAHVIFDDELDLGTRTWTSNPVQQSRRDTQSTLTSVACLPILHMKQASWILHEIAPVIPVESAACISQIFAEYDDGEESVSLAPAISIRLVDTLVSCAVHAVNRSFPEAPALVERALIELGGQTVSLMFLLHKSASPRIDYGAFVYNKTRALLRALLGPHGLATARGLLDQVKNIVFDFLDYCAREPFLARLNACSSIRIAQCNTITAMFEVNSPRLFDEEVGKQLASIVFDLTNDLVYEARIVGAELIPRIFMQYKATMNLYTDVKSSLARPSPAANCTPEQLETSIIFFGISASACHVVELDCIVELAREAATSPTSLPLVVMTMNCLSLSLGYSDRYALSAWHLKKFLFHWFVSNSIDERHASFDYVLSLRSVIAPSKSAATDGYSFCKACAPTLVAVLILAQQYEDLSVLSNLLGVTVEALVTKHIDAVMSLVVPGIQSSAVEMMNICRNVFDTGGWLSSLLTHTELELKYSANIVSAIGLMLTAAEEPEDADSEPDPPAYTPESIVRTVKNIPAKNNEKENEEILWGHLLSDPQVADILLKVHMRLQSAQNSRHAFVAIGALRSTLLLLGHRVAHPATLRYAISILIRCFKVSTLRPLSAVLLRDVIDHGIDHGGGAAVGIIGVLLPSIVSALAAAIEESANETEDISGLTELLNKITLHAPEVLEPYLKTVDPLPGIHGMQQASAKISRCRDQVAPAEQLNIFAERVASMPLTLRHHSIHALRAVLSQNPSSLYCSDGSSIGIKCHPEVATAAWRLVSMSKESADSRLVEFAGELLALAGPLDSNKLVFDISSISTGGSNAHAKKKPQPTTSSSSSSSNLRSSECDAWTTAVSLLCDYLIDDNTQVIHEAQACLRHILNTEEGLHGSNALDEETRQLVHVFAPFDAAARSRRGSASADTGVQNGLIVDENLWNAGDVLYDEWICELCASVLQQCTSKALLCCQKVVHLKPAFAELLLPLGLADWARHFNPVTATYDAPQALANAIRNGILCDASTFTTHNKNTNRKAFRMLLCCLNHLRDIYLKSHTHTLKERPLPPSILAWTTVYWIKLDYLMVASHAVKCKAYFSALVYIEAYCKMVNNGHLGLPPQNSETASENKRVTELLLEIYSKIDEPDGLYAFSMSSGSLPQLRRSERQGNWIDALVLSDIALQLSNETARDAARLTDTRDAAVAAAAAAGNRGQESSTTLDIPREDALNGMRRCLTNLGASHLLSLVSSHEKLLLSQQQQQQQGHYSDRYNNGMNSSRGAVGPASSHHRHYYYYQQQQQSISAVSLGIWMPLDPGTAEAAATDSSLVAAVDALGAGAAERCSQAISSARRVLVRALATAGLESTGDVNPALVRLQMLQEVSEAWNILWPGLPHLGSIGAASLAASRETLRGSRAASPLQLDASIDGLQLLQNALKVWQAREAAAGGGQRYHLLAPLQDLRHQLLRTIKAPDAEATCLLQTAMSARQSKHYGQATACVARLHSMAQDAVQANTPWAEDIARVLAPWRIEEAKLFWDRGQKEAAVSAARSLFLEFSKNSAATAPATSIQAKEKSPIDARLESIYLKSLLAEWMADTQSESSQVILSFMIETNNQILKHYQAELVAPTSAHSNFADDACQVFYRLGNYSDTLYRNALHTMIQPEWVEEGRAIEHRCKQAHRLLTEREKQINHARDSFNIELRKSLPALVRDVSERRALIDKVSPLLHTALKAYENCLVYGAKYDVDIVFRLVQLWLAIGAPSDNRGTQQWSNTYKNNCNTALDAADEAILALQRAYVAVKPQRGANEVQFRQERTANNHLDRFCAIRVPNPDNALLNDIHFIRCIADIFLAAPSFKLLPLIYQVASRLSPLNNPSQTPSSSSSSSPAMVSHVFQQCLHSVLARLGSEHPFHCIPQFIALKNTTRAKQSILVNSQTDTEWAFVGNKDKEEAAGQLLQAIAASSERNNKIVADYTIVSEQYIELSRLSPETQTLQRKFTKPVEDATSIPVISANINIDLSLKYTDYPYITKFSTIIKYTGGMNRPKLITATDSYGNTIQQLVKTKDDLRQDAVVQQYFNLMNGYLIAARETASRDLKIRTYRVVPFSPNAGVLQFVGNTASIHDLFTSCYRRYKRFNDYTIDQTYTIFKSIQDAPLDEKCDAMLDIYSNFAPVFHNYFLERYIEPGAWFEARLRFSRSVAVNSMAGHIIGLGDRHCSNILLDKETLEVIHIDLGIAFDQGKDQPVPERVPFRLTHNIVDAFGVTGVEGIFRRCCEETLRVVRAEKMSLMTVLEVFVYDPLHDWSLSLKRNKQRIENGNGDKESFLEMDDTDDVISDENGGRETTSSIVGDDDDNDVVGNARAKGSMLRIKQKLEGVEQGDSASRSVEGQVQHLLCEAMKVENLCQMFIGWRPYV